MSKSRKKRRSRTLCRSGLPKGEYRYPSGGIVTVTHGVDQAGRPIVIQALHRAEPDLHRLAKSYIAQALEEIQSEQKRKG